ncbi:uncharacterized protein LOC102674684 isoform X2 [Apis dorsata]|uniref:uncharacterized protein LOC102674684 isoform X2 n=1 Tax=Apis dorsata TaxID=7462 RepID=UPI001293840A|nr:uncharacterized protein LOC102674684 isoform X2 [Apis dorsata]
MYTTRSFSSIYTRILTHVQPRTRIYGRANKLQRTRGTFGLDRDFRMRLSVQTNRPTTLLRYKHQRQIQNGETKRRAPAKTPTKTTTNNKGRVTGLKLLGINVPAYSLRGKSALLECRYDLETDKLYSITWYKDHEEFYRYVPRGEPKKHTYHVEGVKVDYRRSDHQQVLLQNVSLYTSGKYKCEVITEAPSFNAVNAEANMEIVGCCDCSSTSRGTVDNGRGEDLRERRHPRSELHQRQVSSRLDVQMVHQWEAGEARHGNGVRAARTLLGDIQFTATVGTESLRWRQNKRQMRGDRGIGFKLGRAAPRDSHNGSFRRRTRDHPRVCRLPLDGG